MAEDEGKGGKPGTDGTTDDGGKPSGKPAEEDTAGLKSALQKERDARKAAEADARKNADAAKRLQDLEDADKSEIEKAQKRAADADARAEKAEQQALRLEIAGEKGLTVSQAKRLVGATRAELEADAEELLEAFGGKAAGSDKDGKNDKDGKGASGGRPTEDLQSGARTGEPEEVDAKQAQEIADRVSKRGF